MNISLVVRDSQQYLAGTNMSGGAAAISAAARLMALEVGSVIGDIVSDLTAAEAIMTSSVGLPQCSFSTYNGDVSNLKTFAYLFRTVPGVQAYLEALSAVVEHYDWKKISVLYTSDAPGLLGDKLFSTYCEMKGIDVMRVGIPLPDDDSRLSYVAQGPINAIKNSDSRIHILIAPRSSQVTLLSAIRDCGLFRSNHVWLTTVDQSDALARLVNPSDFNGLIMADALWDMPSVPAFNTFVNNWKNLDKNEYPLSGSTQLTWHETYAYACVQLLTEGYKGLVQSALAVSNGTLREKLLFEILHGKRSQDLTLEYLGTLVHETPVGNITINKEGDPEVNRISIMSFQNYTSVQSGCYLNGNLSFFKPIQFKDGTTTVPSYAPSSTELKPDRDNAFELTMTILCSLLMLVIIATGVIVLLNRHNIIIKSASPVFCILELCGLALTLSWIYLRSGVPSGGVCRVGLTISVVGLTVNLSALVVKNYRIYRIFNAVSVINHAVSNRYLLRVVAIPVVITLDPQLVHTNSNEYWVVCKSDSSQIAWSVITAITPAIMILFGIYLAFKTRNVSRLWNEARSIAITIYMVAFFVVIIIIVQTFPFSLYQVTHHTTLACVFVGCLLQYVILFYPKLRNLWLQKRGLHVAAGHEAGLLDNIMASNGNNNHNHNSSRLGGSGPYTEKGYRFASGLDGGGSGMSGRVPGDGGESINGRSGMYVGSDQGSILSTDAQRNPNISDLISSYPFGQLSGENSKNFMSSSADYPSMYGQSSLMNRGRGRRGAIRRSNDGDHDGNRRGSSEIEELELLDSQRRQLGLSSNTDSNNGANTGMSAKKLPAENVKYDTFGHGAMSSNAAATLKTNRDAQPVDLREILMLSSNRSRGGSGGDGESSGQSRQGSLTAPGTGADVHAAMGAASRIQHRPSTSSLGTGLLGPPAHDYFGSDLHLTSRKSSFTDFDYAGLGGGGGGTGGGKMRLGQNRNPKLYPLQSLTTNTGVGFLRSGMPLRELRAS
ncbi:hypothetical protein EDD11_004747 [Mortierella claussenii]|nr:hypothetical protein EDD11_004747 [Mortierella claussenii]